MTLSPVTYDLKSLETSSSLGLFARDTGGCLISRVGLSRSKQEREEVSMAEISESAIFYFSAPLLAKTFGKMFDNLYGIKKDVINEPLEVFKSISKDALKKLQLAKLGQILSVFSIILPLVYSIAPVRNLITLSKTGEDEFVSVVGLKKDNKNKDENKKSAKDKALDLIKKTGIAALSSLFATGAILGLCKNDKVYEKLKPLISDFVSKMEFSDKADLKLMHYAALIYPASIAGYFSASRDKYEVMENVRRFCVTVPLLFLGDKVIEKPIYRFFDKCFKTEVMNSDGIKSYSDILKMPENVQKDFLKTKNWAFALNFITSTMLVAAGVALLNRIQTKKHYEKDNNLTKNN